MYMIDQFTSSAIQFISLQFPLNAELFPFILINKHTHPLILTLIYSKNHRQINCILLSTENLKYKKNYSINIATIYLLEKNS